MGGDTPASSCPHHPCTQAPLRSGGDANRPEARSPLPPCAGSRPPRTGRPHYADVVNTKMAEKKAFHEASHVWFG